MLKNHVYSILGQRSIDSIRPGDLRDPFLKLHAKGLSKASVALARDVVNAPLSYDVDAELKSVNPITGVIKTLHNERGKREHLDYFTNDEVKLFLNMPEAFRGILPIFPLGFPRGARLGELLRFKWADID